MRSPITDSFSNASVDDENTATERVVLTPRKATVMAKSQPNYSFEKLLAGRRILLVEDSPDNQILFVRMLQSAGAFVEIADNGSEGVRLEEQAAHTAAYEAIIMDIRMPVMDGYQATLAIRARGFRGPIIALTAHAVPGEEERCRSVGCSHFLLKPVTRAELIETVRAACQIADKAARS